MALSPQKFREIVFQLLYSHELGHPDADAMTALFMAELEVSKRNVLAAQEKARAVIATLSEIDPKIAAVATSYSFERIQMVTKSILRLGVYELFHDTTVPPKVAIAEAMRLARKFGTPESALFVNALLDNIYQASLGKPTTPEALNETIQALIESEKPPERLPEKEEESI